MASMPSMRAMAAAMAMERTAKSSNEKSNAAQGFDRSPAGQTVKPQAPRRGYEGRPNEPQGREAGYNARPNERQPMPPAGNNNTRSNPPGSAPAMERNSSPTTPSTRAPRGAQSNEPGPQPEPTPARIAQPIGGDSFSRASSRARARLRGSRNVTS